MIPSWLEEGLKLAITPLAALLAGAIVPWLVSLFRIWTVANGEELQNGNQVNAGDPRDRAIDRITVGLASISLLDILVILVYVVLPESEHRTLIGTISASLFLMLVGIIVNGRRVIPLLVPDVNAEQQQPDQQPADDELRALPLSLRFAWTIDLAVLVLLAGFICGALSLIAACFLDLDYPSHSPDLVHW